MTHAIRTHETTKPRSGLLGAAFALGLGTLLLSAQPADAGNEFKNAFEDELGRIVAHHVAAIGTAVIVPGVVVHQRVHYSPPRRAHRAHRGHRGHRGHHGRHGYERGHRHHRGCGHAYGPSRVTVIEKRYRHGRHDRVDRHRKGNRHHGHRGSDRRSRYDY